MRKIKYVVKNGQSVTACPCGMTSFAGEPKMAGTLGCIMCVNHAGQSYTADGGVVCCLRGDETRSSRGTRSSRDGAERTTNGADKGERQKRAKRSDGLNGLNGADGKTKTKTKRVTKKVTKKVSKNNNTKMKKEEKI